MSNHQHAAPRTPTASPAQLWRAVRDDLRERREANAHRRDLEQELASYQSQAEVDDLLEAIRDQEGAEADAMRDVLLRNLRRHESSVRLAS